MTSQNDAMVILLANRCYLYTLMQHIFGHALSRELLECITSEHTKEALGLLSNDGEAVFVPYLSLFTELKREILHDAESVLDQLKSEYTYFMLGPGKLPAPPWESVYVTKERLLFQESTLKVRRAYLNYQLLPNNHPHEADDHIALELNFMAHLAKLSQECFEEEDTGKFKRLLKDQKMFLEEHLLCWIGTFAEQMQSAGRGRFYPPMAMLTERIINIDRDMLDELFVSSV